MTRDVSTPTQAAIDWLARDDLDRSPQREAFAAWLDESQDHREAWIQVHRMWDLFEDAEDNDVIAALARAARQAGPEPVGRPARPWLVAASIAIAMVSATILVGVQQGWFARPSRAVEVAADGRPSLGALGRADYVTGKSERSIVDLPDGTRVTLDADSAIDVAFVESRRDVRLLNGHVFFDVAHDRDHPFAVQADGHVITALGTQFDVRAATGVLSVVLAEGRVSIVPQPRGPAAAPVVLSPGQAFAVRQGQTAEVTTVDLGDALSWRQSAVEFRDQTLRDAVGVLNRYTRAQIVITDPKVAALRITGVFRTGDTARFGRSVSEVLPVRMVVRDADTYELVSSPNSRRR